MTIKDKLTLEQSQRLIDWGIDPTEASEKAKVYETIDAKHRWESEMPVFSLSDILRLLPREIRDAEIWEHFYLTIETDCNNTWLATYREYCGGEIVMEIGEKVAPELIDALYELLVWVLQNHPDKIKKLGR